MVNGYSPSLPSARIIGECWAADVAARAVVWYERVPSPSNCSDAPSRFKYEEFVRMFPDAVWSEPVFPASWAAGFGAEETWFVDVFKQVVRLGSGALGFD